MIYIVCFYFMKGTFNLLIYMMYKYSCPVMCILFTHLMIVSLLFYFNCYAYNVNFVLAIIMTIDHGCKNITHTHYSVDKTSTLVVHYSIIYSIVHDYSIIIPTIIGITIT